MRLINADALHKSIDTETYRHTYIDQIHKVIDDVPIIDAVPVVRCKDCKWADWYKTAGGEQFCYCMETDNGGRSANDFCSYGEREQE